MNRRPTRSPSRAPGEGAAARAAAFVASLALLIVGGWLYLTPHEWTALFERDLPAYQGAIDAFAAGHDPYTASQVRQAHGLPFIAPPFVWQVYKLAAHAGVRPVFSGLLITLDLVSIVALPAILSRLLLGPGWARTAVGAGFFFTAFAGSGFYTALVMNSGTPLYALIALGLIPAVTSNRWLGFHLAVALATAFKPFYAAFWIVPVLAEGARQWGPSAIAMACAAATYVAPMVLAPKLFAAWLHTLVQQTVGDRRVGLNLLGAAASAPVGRHDHLAPYALQVALSAVLLGAALLLGRLDRTLRIAGLMLAAVFLDPRAMRYDLSTAAIPLLALVAGALSRGPPGALAQAAWAVVLAAGMAMLSHNTTADGFVYAAVAAGALVVAVAASHASGTAARTRS